MKSKLLLLLIPLTLASCVEESSGYYYRDRGVRYSRGCEDYGWGDCGPRYQRRNDYYRPRDRDEGRRPWMSNDAPRPPRDNGDRPWRGNDNPRPAPVYNERGAGGATVPCQPDDNSWACRMNRNQQ